VNYGFCREEAGKKKSFLLGILNHEDGTDILFRNVGKNYH